MGMMKLDLPAPLPEGQVVRGTEEQQAIWAMMEDPQASIIVNALAGSGKTHSAIEAARRAQARRESPVGGRGQAVYLAFNKSVEEEMTRRAPHVMARTFHSYGYGAVRAQFGRIDVDTQRGRRIVEEIVEEGDQRFPARLLRGRVRKVVSLAKQYGVVARADLERIVDHHGVDLGRREEQDEALGWVPRVMERMMDIREGEGIDYDDMVWLPFAHGMEMPRSRLVISDESQDLNVVQRWMAARAGEQTVVIGDRFQSIYQFRGADMNAIDELGKEVEARLRGEAYRCDLGLTYTFRCPHSHVALANQIVPELKAMPNAIDGTVSEAEMDQFYREVQPKDMVLCRCNTPLIKAAYRLIAMGKSARIRGKDIGEGVMRLVTDADKQGVSGDLTGILKRAAETTEKEVRKFLAMRDGQGECIGEMRAAAARDRLECLVAAAEGVHTVWELEAKLKGLFSDGKEGTGILLSTVHKAKGLEADKVWILKPDLMPHPAAKKEWEKQQERNIKYVALTRGRKEMVMVWE